MIRFDAVTVSYRNRPIIRDISFEVSEFERVVLYGKSGSGKSVIVKCIVKLMEADSGTIQVFGREIFSCRESELAEIRTRIGFLFQEGALYDSMSIRENLLFPTRRNSRLRKMPEKELLELVGMAIGV